MNNSMRVNFNNKCIEIINAAVYEYSPYLYIGRKNEQLDYRIKYDSFDEANAALCTLFEKGFLRVGAEYPNDIIYGSNISL